MTTEAGSHSAAGLHLRTFREEDIVIVACSGKLMAESSPHLKEHVKRMLPREKRIVLDLVEITRLDSAGLGVLVGLYISAKNANCELQLVNLSKPVRDLLGLSHLLSVFEACGQAGTRHP